MWSWFTLVLIKLDSSSLFSTESFFFSNVFHLFASHICLSWSRVVFLVCRCHLSSISVLTVDCTVHSIARRCVFARPRKFFFFFYKSTIALFRSIHNPTHITSPVCLQCNLPLSWVWGSARGGGNSFLCPSFFAVGTIGCCTVSFLALAQPSLSGEWGLILYGCVWFLWWSIDPVATYLIRRAPNCLFWWQEGSSCEVALTICTVHQSSPRQEA